jgi:ElaB/YqjD/DUF883 family membrane-anchored ribosome-binding protein
METNKVLDLGGDSVGQRVAQKISSVAESVDKMKGVGCEGLKQKVVEYARREPLTALGAAAAAGILLAWVTNRRGGGPVQ